MNENEKKFSIDWKQKLTSRKFWSAVVGFVSPIMIAFGCSDSTITQAVGIIMGSATLIAYIIGEGLVDSSRAAGEKGVSTNTYINTTSEDKK